MKEVTISFQDMWWPRRVLSLVCLCRAKYRVYQGEPDKIEPEWKHEDGVATCSLRFRLLDLVKSVEYRWAPFWSEARRVEWEQDGGYAVSQRINHAVSDLVRRVANRVVVRYFCDTFGLTKEEARDLADYAHTIVDLATLNNPGPP